MNHFGLHGIGVLFDYDLDLLRHAGLQLRASRHRQWLVEFYLDVLLTQARLRQIVGRLHSYPYIWCSAKSLGKADRHVGGYATLTKRFKTVEPDS